MLVTQNCFSPIDASRFVKMTQDYLVGWFDSLMKEKLKKRYNCDGQNVDRSVPYVTHNLNYILQLGPTLLVSFVKKLSA